MIIVIEGIDGSGKTTLADQLSTQTNYPIIHMAQPKSEYEKQHMMGQYMQVLHSSRNIIFDRCWYSEMAYGPVMRNSSMISFPQMYELERQLVKAGGLIIHCTGPKAALWSRCQKRGEEYVTLRSQFEAIYDNFVEIFNAPHLVPVVKYEYKKM